jgi:hypothetical protein
MAPRYQAVVGRELKKYGLRYEDLYDPQMDLVSALVDVACPHDSWLVVSASLQEEPGAAAGHQRPSKKQLCSPHQASRAPACLPARPTHRLNPMLQDVDEALKRLPQDMLDARNQRLRRASDLNMKHSELPKELQQLQTPFELYVKDTLDVSDSSGCS